MVESDSSIMDAHATNHFITSIEGDDNLINL